MKHALWIAAIAVTVFALSLNAIAQPGGGQGGQRGQGQGAGQGAGQGQFAQMGAAQTTPQALLRNAEVVRTLSLTAAQTTALNELFPQGRGAGAGPGAGAGAQQLTAAERAAQQRTRTAEQWAGIAGILNAEQLKKFNDIYFQVNVPVVNPNAPAGAPVPIMNLNAYLLGAVELTAAQKEAITKIANDRDEANQAAGGFGGGGGGQQLTAEERTARMTATRERNTKANDEITALLTAAQKTKLDELRAGAAAVRTSLGIGQQRPGGQGAAPQPGAGGGQRGQGAGGGGGFQPGENSWQPGQGAPAGGGNRPAGQGAGRRAGGGN